MGERTVRELLNRLRWNTDEDAAAVEIAYAVRGEGGERVDVAGFADVIEILPGGVTLPGETFIPYHRIRSVRRGGEELWCAREKRGGNEG